MAADDKQRSLTALRDLRPGMKNVTCVFIVIDKGTTNQTKDGSIVRKCRVADKSASICFSLWNEQAEAIEAGDILRLTKGYASMWKGGMMLYSGKYGILEKIGEFTMVYSEIPDMSDPNQEFLQSQQPPHHNQPVARGGGMGGVIPQQLPHQPPCGGGFPNSIPPPQGGPGPHNGRIGMGIGMNRNGNNHINHSMATGYSPHPPEGRGNSEGGCSRPEPASCDQPVMTVTSQHQANFSMSYRDSPPRTTPTSGQLPHQLMQASKANSVTQSQSCDHRGGKQPVGSGGSEPRFTHNGRDDTAHQHYNGRTPRGGYRNFVERPHPYSRLPQADPPRHRGGWR